MKRFLLFIVLLILVFLTIQNGLLKKPTSKKLMENPGDKIAPSETSTDFKIDQSSVKIVAENLNIPWDIAFLSSIEFLVTERPGNLVKIRLESDKTIVKKIETVVHNGEGGLLGLTLDPNYENNKFLYMYYTYSNNGNLFNKVERYKFENDTLSEPIVIIDGIKGSRNHDGGRIRFGPDNLLYITTGDAEDTATAQDVNSLNGKILRIKSDGSIPEGNVNNSAVFSLGHRNPQGITWDGQGSLWSSEHGPSGLQTGNDEINLIEIGKNYGWPTIKGTQTADGMETPVAESGKGNAWAPGDILYYNKALYLTGLRGSAIYRAQLNGNKITTVTPYLKGEFGRIRTIVMGPDGFFYITTSNRDGRGVPKINDDKVIRISPKVFE